MSCSTRGLGGLDPECLQALPDVGGESIGASGSTEIRDIPRPERCFQKPLLEHSFPLKTTAPHLVPALPVLKLVKETSQPAPVGPTASAVSLCPAHLSSARSLPPSQQTAGSLGGRGSYRHAGSSQALWFPGSESLHSFII